MDGSLKRNFTIPACSQGYAGEALPHSPYSSQSRNGTRPLGECRSRRLSKALLSGLTDEEVQDLFCCALVRTAAADDVRAEFDSYGPSRPVVVQGCQQIAEQYRWLKARGDLRRAQTRSGRGTQPLFDYREDSGSDLSEEEEEEEEEEEDGSSGVSEEEEEEEVCIVDLGRSASTGPQQADGAAARQQPPAPAAARPGSSGPSVEALQAARPGSASGSVSGPEEQLRPTGSAEPAAGGATGASPSRPSYERDPTWPAFKAAVGTNNLQQFAEILDRREEVAVREAAKDRSRIQRLEEQLAVEEQRKKAIFEAYGIAGSAAACPGSASGSVSGAEEQLRPTGSAEPTAGGATGAGLSRPSYECDPTWPALKAAVGTNNLQQFAEFLDRREEVAAREAAKNRSRIQRLEEQLAVEEKRKKTIFEAYGIAG